MVLSYFDDFHIFNDVFVSSWFPITLANSRYFDELEWRVQLGPVRKSIVGRR